MGVLSITLIFLTALILGFLLFIKYRKPKMALIPKTTDGKVDPDRVKNVAITDTNIILYIDGYPIQFPRTGHLLQLVNIMPPSCISDFSKMKFDEIWQFFSNVGTKEKVIVFPVEYDKSMLIDSSKWTIENVIKAKKEYELALNEKSPKLESTSTEFSTGTKIGI